MIDYLGVFLVTLAAIIAVFGKTTDDTHKGIRHLTGRGWVAVFVTIGGALIQTAITHNNNEDKRNAAMQRDRIRQLALTDLRYTLTSLIATFERLKPGNLGEGPYKADLFWKEGAFKRFCELKPSDRVSSFTDSPRWDDYVARRARDASDQFDRNLARYAQYLDAETIVLVEEVRNNVQLRALAVASEWGRLFATHDGVEVPFCGINREMTGFAMLVQSCTKLEQNIEQQLATLNPQFEQPHW